MINDILMQDTFSLVNIHNTAYSLVTYRKIKPPPDIKWFGTAQISPKNDKSSPLQISYV